MRAKRNGIHSPQVQSAHEGLPAQRTSRRYRFGESSGKYPFDLWPHQQEAQAIVCLPSIDTRNESYSPLESTDLTPFVERFLS